MVLVLFSALWYKIGIKLKITMMGRMENTIQVLRGNNKLSHLTILCRYCSRATRVARARFGWPTKRNPVNSVLHLLQEPIQRRQKVAQRNTANKQFRPPLTAPIFHAADTVTNIQHRPNGCWLFFLGSMEIVKFYLAARNRNLLSIQAFWVRWTRF